MESKHTATRVDGGWLYFDEQGQQIGFRFDWTPMDDWIDYVSSVKWTFSTRA